MSPPLHHQPPCTGPPFAERRRCRRTWEGGCMASAQKHGLGTGTGAPRSLPDPEDSGKPGATKETRGPHPTARPRGRRHRALGDKRGQAEPAADADRTPGWSGRPRPPPPLPAAFPPLLRDSAEISPFHGDPVSSQGSGSGGNTEPQRLGHLWRLPAQPPASNTPRPQRQMASCAGCLLRSALFIGHIPAAARPGS